MATFLFFIVGLACLLSILLIWLLLSSMSLRKKNQKLHQHITITESELIRAKESLHHFEKKFSKNQDNQLNSSHQNELLELRRDNARLKDELKKLKDDLRIKDIDIKKLEALHIDKLYLITQERDTLVSQLKDLDSSNKIKNQNLEYTIQDLQTDRKSLLEKLNNFEKQTKHNIAKAINLQSKLNIAEQEIETLRKKTESNHTGDQIILNRWKERALCARQMYQLMRQMRELSDNKVQSYQDGVMATSEWILKQTNTPTPNIAENENKADRFLAEAWAAVIGTNYSENPLPMHESILETRV